MTGPIPIAMPPVVRRAFDPRLVGNWDAWSGYYTSFHADEPWGEYLWCAKCSSGFDEFGPNGSIGLKEATKSGLSTGVMCPRCGIAGLELFWGSERMQRYVRGAMDRPGFDGEVVFHQGELLCWWWGYEHLPAELEGLIPVGGAFYVDVIATDPTMRDRHQLWVGTRTFVSWLERLSSRYQLFCMRTHRRAASVIFLSELIGFEPTGVASEDDGERCYWTRSTDLDSLRTAHCDVDEHPLFAGPIGKGQ